MAGRYGGQFIPSSVPLYVCMYVCMYVQYVCIYTDDVQLLHKYFLYVISVPIPHRIGT